MAKEKKTHNKTFTNKEFNKNRQHYQWLFSVFAMSNTFWKTVSKYKLKKEILFLYNKTPTSKAYTEQTVGTTVCYHSRMKNIELNMNRGGSNKVETKLLSMTCILCRQDYFF